MTRYRHRETGEIVKANSGPIVNSTLYFHIRIPTVTGFRAQVIRPDVFHAQYEPCEEPVEEDE